MHAHGISQGVQVHMGGYDIYVSLSLGDRISFRVYRRDDLLVADRRPTTAMRGSLLFLLAAVVMDTL